VVVSILAEILEAKGLSRRQLAKDCGVTANAIGNACKAHHSLTPIISLKTLNRICVALDMAPGDLLKLQEG